MTCVSSSDESVSDLSSMDQCEGSKEGVHSEPGPGLRPETEPESGYHHQHLSDER